MFEKYFKNEYERTRELVQAPNWYLEFGRVQKAHLLGTGAVQAAFSGNVRQAVQSARQYQLDIFEQLLVEHAVRLGKPGKEELDDQDEERQPVSNIVIHHSSRSEGISLTALNALHLLNLYVPVYQNQKRPVLTSEGEHQPIYSGHFNDEGDQVFYGYHWKVQQDGMATRLLPDSALGWHAGDWEMNKKSVGICIDDDLEHSSPTEASLDSVASIIRAHYPNISVSNETIVGHNETFSTICPGDQFINGWKEKLLERAV